MQTAAMTAVAGRTSALHALAGGADRMRWFREAKFGMFIHWGPYSVAGVEASWPILKPTGEISETEYRALPERFKPTSFDPHAWIELARSAGQRYMVFTAKHCDGFCMFDSDYTDYKITRTPYGKDILRQLSDACREDSMPLGLYYSPPDVNHPAYRDTSKPSYTNYHGEPERPEWPLYLDYMGLQLDELLTRYGPVATMWFDWFDAVNMRMQERYDGQRFLDQLRRLQPATLVNERLGIPGDFRTPEQIIPKSVPVKGGQIDSVNHKLDTRMANAVPRQGEFQPWETCMTINNAWAYKPRDRDFKSPDTLIRSLIEVVSRGGNFLLDVGPQPDGQIQLEFVERLKAMGEWTTLNAPAIYGSTYGPVQGLSGCRTTSRGASVFVFVMDEHATEARIGPIERAVHRVRLVATGKPLNFQPIAKGIRVSLDKALWEHGIPVLELR
jgi:alpha-L-fucosidase